MEKAVAPMSSKRSFMVVRFKRGTISASESSTPTMLTSSGTRLPADCNPSIAPYAIWSLAA